MPVVLLLLALVVIRALMWVVARDEADPSVRSLALEHEFEGETGDGMRVPVHDDARGLFLPAAERPEVDVADEPYVRPTTR